MNPVAKIVGCGIVSTLGAGVRQHLDVIRQGQGQFATRTLTGFHEPIDAPFLAAAGSDVSRSARAHCEWLLDQALAEALSGCPLTAQQRQSLPIFIGSSSYGIGIGEEIYRQAVANAATGGEPPQPLPLDGFTQISQHLRQSHHLYGADYAYNTACTASANALLSAVSSIALGQHEYALVVGVETFNATTLSGFFGMQLLSHEVMRPFDRRRNGLVLGEGCAVLLLQAGADDGEGFTLRGGASGCDSFSISASNPDGSSIAAVMQRALDRCQLQASDIMAIKAHGTASPMNDNGEAAGMRRIFPAVPPFFSLKSYIGHTLGSCGAMETALMVGCIRAGWLPVSAGFAEADEELSVTPLIAAQPAPAGHYLLNFFGFGGNNCSLILHAGAPH